MHVAAQILDAATDTAELTQQAGIAYGLTGMLRSLSFHAARGKLFLPRDLVTGEADAISGHRPAELKRAITRVESSAIEHLASAARIVIPRTVVGAVLPASLVPAYLSRLANNPDPLRGETEISQLRRQLIMLRAALLKRL
jgi:phytoene synthase